MADIDLGMNLYEFNQMGMANEPPLDVIALQVKTREMIEDLYSTKNPYWMLLCRELNDYTVFIMITIEGTVEEMLETLKQNHVWKVRNDRHEKEHLQEDRQRRHDRCYDRCKCSFRTRSSTRC